MAVIIVTAATSAATPPTAKAAVIHFRTRFIDVQRAAANFLAIQSFNCFFGLAPVRHLNKAKATGPTRSPVCDY